MTLKTSTIAFAVVLTLVTAACQDKAVPPAPVMAPTVLQSSGNAAPIVGAHKLAELRQVTARFQSLAAAKQAGYTTQITPCWAHHSSGGMGYHYGNTALFDATVDLLHPETVIYEPQAGGNMRLVGMEYIVPIDAWAAAGHNLDDPTDVPELLEQKYTRHSFLPIFKLHIWLWQDNPKGTFADWNPKVSCQYADSTVVF